MNLTKHIKEGLLRIKVSPNARKTKLVEDNGLRLYIKEIPDKNKANLALIKFFKKKFNLKVTIKSGMKSRDKVLKVSTLR
jgi:uncharacterized protein (TIGR00251 family)